MTSDFEVSNIIISPFIDKFHIFMISILNSITNSLSFGFVVVQAETSTTKYFLANLTTTIYFLAACVTHIIFLTPSINANNDINYFGQLFINISYCFLLSIDLFRHTLRWPLRFSLALSNEGLLNLFYSRKL